MPARLLTVSMQYRLAFMLISMSTCWLSSSYASEKVSLRWQYKDGREFVYQIQEQTTLGSERIGLKEKLTCDLRVKCTRTSAKETELSVMIERIQLSVTGDVGNGAVKVEVDTRDGTSTGSGSQGLREHFSTIVGSVISLRIDERGRAGQPKLEEALVEKLRGNGAKELAGFFGDPVSPVGIMRRLHAMFIVLPEEDVTDGDTWDHADKWDALDYADIVFKSQYNYIGSGERSGTHRVGLKAEETMSMSSSPDIKSEGKVIGEFLFDAVDGCLEQATVTCKHVDFFESIIRISRTPTGERPTR